MHWQECSATDLPKVLSLLQEVQFPFVQDAGSRTMIYSVLQDAKCLVMFDGDSLIGWVGLAHVGQGWWSFDIAIKPSYQRKWAYKDRLIEIGKYVFTNLQAEGIIGVSYNPASIRPAIKAGFMMTEEKDPHGGVILRMSRKDAEGKWF